MLNSTSMGHPRSHFIDPLKMGVYHCTSRCVRRESLIESDERCSWIIGALDRLCRVFAIDVCDFAIMRNHVHLLLRTHPELAMAWSPQEVARRWLCRHGSLPEEVGESINDACRDPNLIEDWRSRLSDLGWFHKLWKEPAAKAWNREDQVTGHFWAGRFHSVGCHDESSILMQATYILLNPVHCGMERSLGESGRTSLGRRLARLQDAIKAGGLSDGVNAYRRSLLEPAIPCTPGPDAPRLTDAEWSKRLARSAHARAIREEAVAKAYGSLRMARRSFTDRPTDCAERKDVAQPLDTDSCPKASLDRERLSMSEISGGVDRIRTDRPSPTISVTRRRNPWRGRASLSVVHGCTLLDFIEFVDDRSRIPRPDKPCHVLPYSLRLTDRVRSRLKAEGVFVPRPSRRSRRVPEDPDCTAYAGSTAVPCLPDVWSMMDHDVQANAAVRHRPSRRWP